MARRGKLLREDRLSLLWDRFREERVGEKPFWLLTLEEKALILQLGIVDPFDDLTPIRPTAGMGAETKGAVLLWNLVHGHPLYEIRINDLTGSDTLYTEVPLDFTGVNLNIFGLQAAKLCKGNFYKADARNAVLSDVDFSGANLQEANLEGAFLNGANLCGCVLKDYIGFPFCRDAIIDVETYKRSGWTPSVLKDWHRAGVRILALEEFPVAAIQAILKGFRVDTAPIFLSYGGCDSDVATQIATFLENHGLRVWFAPWDIDIGDNIFNRIQKGLELSKTFLILMSPEALARPWVVEELSSAFHKALHEPGREIIPIRYKPCKLPPFLGSRKWLDLQEPYIDALEDLCRRLRREPRHRASPKDYNPKAETENENFMDGTMRLLGKKASIIGAETLHKFKIDAMKQMMEVTAEAFDKSDEKQLESTRLLFGRCGEREEVWGGRTAPPPTRLHDFEYARQQLLNRFPDLLRTQPWPKRPGTDR